MMLFQDTAVGRIKHRKHILKTEIEDTMRKILKYSAIEWCHLLAGNE
jgi:hypothetical protein